MFSVVRPSVRAYVTGRKDSPTGFRQLLVQNIWNSVLNDETRLPRPTF